MGGMLLGEAPTKFSSQRSFLLFLRKGGSSCRCRTLSLSIKSASNWSHSSLLDTTN